MACIELYGKWEVDKKESESLKPFFVASGCPSFAAPLMVKLFDTSVCHIEKPGDQTTKFRPEEEGGGEGAGEEDIDEENAVFIAQKLKGLFPKMMPGSLQTEYIVCRKSHTLLDTPTGKQRAKLISMGRNKIHIRRDGPKENEACVEMYELTGDHVMMNTAQHVSPNKTVTVKRVFRRVQS
jgi:hypothetical protein